MRKLIVSKSIRLLAATVVVCVITGLTQAQLQPNKGASYKEKVLYAFTGQSDGWQPSGSVVRNAKGNLYGTTAFGGSLSGLCDSGFLHGGCGVAFKVSAKGKFSLLHTFDFSDGANPTISVQDTSGNLYGTTEWGGNSACQYGGCGVIFKLTPTGEFTLLYSFTGGSDGANPNDLIMDDKGNFYGTTSGSNTDFQEVFKLTNSGSLEVLYVFSRSGHDGNIPIGVIRDSAGNLYGTTFEGGAYGAGTVFKLDTSGKETVLYSFKGKSDGGLPLAPLVMDKAGNLYGTASQYGYEKGNCDIPNSTEGCGTVFKVDTAGVFSVLFAFHNVDGEYPGPLMEDAHGTIYGTTAFGGNCGQGGCGVVYKLTSHGKESVLYNFKGQSGGTWPGNLAEDSKGNLYGTTLDGGDLSCAHGSGAGCGLIFELTR